MKATQAHGTQQLERDTTYWVAVSRLADVGQKIDRWARRPRRGQASVVLVDTGHRREGLTETEACVLLRSSIPIAGAWHLVARLEHANGETRVHVVPGAQGFVAISRWCRAVPRCDYCGVSRQRHTTYLVHDGNHTVRQVGSSCLQDFVGGHDDADGAIGLADLLLEAQAALTAKDGTHKRRVPRRLPPMGEYMAHVVLHAREGGFITRKDADEAGALATAELALRSLRDHTTRPHSRDHRLAGQVVAWARREFARRTDLTGYERRLVAALSADGLGARDTSLVASALLTYQRECEPFLGAPGERVMAIVEVVSAHGGKPTRYGATTIYALRDRAGRSATWFARGTAPLREGRRYRLEATVERQREYRSRADTVLSHCQATPLSAGPA